MLIYAVGDIHGRADLLERLLAMTAQDARRSKAQRRLTVLVAEGKSRSFLST
jgi:hypothetical protein